MSPSTLLISKRAAHGAALLTSACALALALMLWATARAGCGLESLSGSGMLELARGGGLGEAQLQARVRELEVALEVMRMEKMEMRFEREALLREKSQADIDKSRVEEEKEAVLEEARQGLYLDSLVFGQYLKAHAKHLEDWWRARLGNVRRRGIVMSAGGNVPLTNAFVTLRVLRFHLNCTLPAVVMYWGSAKGDSINPTVLPFLKKELPEVEFVDASKLPYPPHQRPLSPERPGGGFAGWKVKVFAIYAAPFQEVLYLDSDSTPLLDPSSLFSSPQYRQAGNLFWPDFYAGDTPWIKAERLFEVLRVGNPWAGKPNMRDFSLDDLSKRVRESSDKKNSQDLLKHTRWTEGDWQNVAGEFGEEGGPGLGRRGGAAGGEHSMKQRGGGQGPPGQVSRSLLQAVQGVGGRAGGAEAGGKVVPAAAGGSMRSVGAGGAGAGGGKAPGVASSSGGSGVSTGIGGSTVGSAGVSTGGSTVGSAGGSTGGSTGSRPGRGANETYESAPRQTEAGQLLLDKTRHWDVLEWLLFLNSHDEVTYRTVHGDKDTFRAAFHLAGKAREFRQVAHFPALSLTDTVTQSKRYYQRGVVQLSPNGALMFHHKAGPLGKFDLGRMEQPPAATHITARASADLGTACVFSGAISNEEIGGYYDVQVDVITPQACNFSMLDWPGAERRCAAAYNPTRRGFDQQMPIFEVPSGSYVAAAEAAAQAAFTVLQESGLLMPVRELGALMEPWDRRRA